MASFARASEALHSAKASSGDVKIRVPLFIVFPPGLSFCVPKEEAPAMSGAPTDRGFHRRETGMDQGTTPKAKIIGLLGKKKKPRPSVGELTKASSGVKKKLARYGPSCKLCILLCTAS
jgi:hypothetical protein